MHIIPSQTSSANPTNMKLSRTTQELTYHHVITFPVGQDNHVRAFNPNQLTFRED